MGSLCCCCCCCSQPFSLLLLAFSAQRIGFEDRNHSTSTSTSSTSTTHHTRKRSSNAWGNNERSRRRDARSKRTKASAESLRGSQRGETVTQYVSRTHAHTIQESPEAWFLLFRCFRPLRCLQLPSRRDERLLCAQLASSFVSLSPFLASRWYRQWVVVCDPVCSLWLLASKHNAGKGIA